MSNEIQASWLGLFITFVNNFCFNLVVMFVCFGNRSSVINLAYSKKLVLLYKYLSNMECYQYSGAALQISDKGRDV